MSKKNQAKAKTEPSYIRELLNTGHVILRAASRDEFGPMIDQIPAQTRYAAGAVGRNTMTGLFELRIDLVTND